MKYPKINKNPHREVNVPSLAGGLNLRDSITNVNDNQLTDCVNMWFKDGKLRTRPLFDTDNSMNVTIDRATNEYVGNIEVYPDVKKDDATLMSASKYVGTKGDGSTWYFYINFWWHDKTYFNAAGGLSIDIPEFEWNGLQSLTEKMEKCSHFLTLKDDIVYCYISNGEDFCIYKLDCNTVGSTWKQVKDDDIYIPTVYAHCKRTDWDNFEGTLFEGFNLIGNSYKMIYSAYNEADSDKSHPMRYKLGQELPESGTIKVSITTCIKGDNKTNERETEVITTLHKIEYGKAEYNKFKKGKIVIETFGDGNTSEDGLRLFIKYNYIGFVIASPDDGDEDEVFVVATLETDEKKERYACNEDNVVITAPRRIDKNDMKKVFCMTKSTWFGGAANGINGGSRLFLCGNTIENEKSLVVWSSLNNPLYFSENNYAYVGDKSQAVMTFGQQGENLVIFKEKSTYYSYYVANDNITADSLINQSVVDYEANNVIYPMVLLNGRIGCDCPDTVQLCRNRLVWTNSDGNVYALYSNNQYSERTIYKLSDMVYPLLSKENDLRNAVSCDFEGHYLLGINNKIYVMDYNSYGYQYAASFGKTEDSNKQIPWYIWEFDLDSNYQILSTQDSLSVGKYFYTDTGGKIVFSVLDCGKNDGRDRFLTCDKNTNECSVIEKTIKSKCTTKFFDFLSAGYLKNIEHVSVGLGNNGGSPIQVNFGSNVGNVSETVMLCGSSINQSDASFIVVKKFYPMMRSVRIFGVNIECEGPLVVDGVSLGYRVLGGVK